MAVTAWFNECPECESDELEKLYVVVEGDKEWEGVDYIQYLCLTCDVEFNENTDTPDERQV